MKYIRTKDNVYEEEKIRTEKEDIERIRLNKEIIAQADTIEKLCDEFIITATSHYSAYIAETHTLEEAIEYCENNHMPKTKIRGAIWTDKGLIYVAKMNKEGDFELI